jgi:SAM-dependent methyltransferase
MAATQVHSYVAAVTSREYLAALASMVMTLNGDDPKMDQVKGFDARPADPIEAFYDQHPYPPPVSDLDRYRDLWSSEDRRKVDHYLHWSAWPYREDISVLVAGCGTSQAAKVAIRRPASRVVGIDVSATSLCHSAALKARYRLDNLDLYELPIEEVAKLGGSFDLILCTGVLHHLVDPMAGLRALRAVLEPHGALHLMVYGRYGRLGIQMLQDYCRRLGVETTKESVDDLLETLGALSRSHPLEHLLRAPDFRRADALADALLNPRDRDYTVSEVFELLDDAEMDFGRWMYQAQYSPQCGAIASTPHAARLRALPVREQFAAVELLRGTIARHSLIAYGRHGSGGKTRIDFAGAAWPAYVPLRLPSTIVVRERQPPGAAAVLLNQAHTYPDLILPVNATELRMVEATDGRRSIGAIAELVGADAERARSLFERLWWYDEVVFDMSGAAGT